MAVVPADDGALVMRFDLRRFPHPAVQTKRDTGVTCKVAVRSPSSRYFENMLSQASSFVTHSTSIACVSICSRSQLKRLIWVRMRRSAYGTVVPIVIMNGQSLELARTASRAS